MNIHHAALFPGLDGFAKSLETKLELSLADQEEHWKQIDAAGEAEFERLKLELIREGAGLSS